MVERVLIIDGLNLFIRNFVVNPTMDANGGHVGGMLGCLRSIKNLVRETKCTLVIVAWDGKGGSLRRRTIFKEYKAGRKPRVNRHLDLDSPEESQQNLHAQHAILRRYLEMLGIVQVEVDNCEADDVISVLCRFVYPETQKVIVSTDRDFFQLVDKHTLIYSPSKKAYVGPGDVFQEAGVPPCNHVLLKAMSGGGDGGDNIHGIKHLGPKTLLKFFPFLAERPVTLEELKEAAQVLAPKGKREKELVKALLAEWEVVITNVRLMQLTEPIVSPQSVRSIRHQAGKVLAAANASAVRLAFVRDGIQLTDRDFFSAFTEYRARAKAAGEGPTT